MQRTITFLLMLMGLALARAQPLDNPEAPNLSTVADSEAWRLSHAQAASVDVDGKRAVQYIAWPANTWEQLRKNRPEQFENAVNPVPDPDGWFHALIEVSDTRVRVYVDHAKEPSLVVERLSKGGVRRPAGLFVDSADGLYANLRLSSGR